MCEFFTSWYAISEPQYTLMLILDQHSDDNYWGVASLMHNADHLLEKDIPIIAYLSRILTTDKVSIPKDIKNLATYQQPLDLISDIFFLGLNDSEKVNYIEQLYQTEYTPKSHAFKQQSFDKLSYPGMSNLDWFGYSLAILEGLGGKELRQNIKVVMQQNDSITLGVVRIS